MSSSSPSNSTQVIPVPPGMTVEQFQTMQGDLVNIAIIAAVVFAVLLWDYLILLPDEIKLYRSLGNSLWKTPATSAFIVLRYSGILATFPSLFFTATQSNYCKVAVGLSQTGVILVVASSGIIFGCRVSAIWNGDKIIHSIVAFFYIFMVGSWFAVATQYRVATGPPTAFASNCQMFDIVAWAPVCYASSVVFDLVILILSLIKIRANVASGVGGILYRDSVVYFFATAITNTVVLAIQALGSNFALVKPAVIPFSTLIVTTMASRVFLNLKLFNQRQVQAQQNLPLSISNNQISSDDHRITNYSAPHPIPAYPPDTKNLHMGSFPSSFTMPIKVTQETFLAS